jgi:hypothetical protein
MYTAHVLYTAKMWYSLSGSCRQQLDPINMFSLLKKKKIESGFSQKCKTRRFINILQKQYGSVSNLKDFAPTHTSSSHIKEI